MRYSEIFVAKFFGVASSIEAYEVMEKYVLI